MPGAAIGVEVFRRQPFPRGFAEVATAGEDGSACLWNAADGRPRFRLPHPKAVTRVAFTADGRSLLTVSKAALAVTADDQTKIVPASGPVMTKADLQASHATIVKIREKLVGLLKKGQGAQNMIDGKAVDEFKDVMPGDAATFLYCAYRGLWAHARELGGIV